MNPNSTNCAQAPYPKMRAKRLNSRQYSCSTVHLRETFGLGQVDPRRFARPIDHANFADLLDGLCAATGTDQCELLLAFAAIRAAQTNF